MNSMLKSFIFLSALFFNQNTHALVSTPDNHKGACEEVKFNTLYHYNDQITGVVNLDIRDPDFDIQELSLQAGGRYSLTDNFKLGVFTGILQHHKHNDDWIKEAGVWQWSNANHKTETIFFPEISYRNLLGQFVYEIRLKYVMSNLFHEKDFFVKASLIDPLNPKWTLIISDEQKISPKNNEKKFTENWLYLIALYRLNPSMMLGPQIGHSTQIWTTSEVHKALRSDYYESHDNSFNAGLVFNLYL